MESGEGAEMDGFVTGHLTLTPTPLPEEAATFTVNTRIGIEENGALEAEIEIVPHGAAGLILPRIGLEWLLPSTFKKVIYYGRGPFENAVDRNTGALIDRYETTVPEMLTPYAKPQDCGSRTDVQWVELWSDTFGIRVETIAPEPFIFSALPHTPMELALAPHQHLLAPSSGTVLNIAARQTGLGSGSCGPGPLERDQTPMRPVKLHLRFILLPKPASR